MGQTGTQHVRCLTIFTKKGHTLNKVATIEINAGKGGGIKYFVKSREIKWERQIFSFFNYKLKKKILTRFFSLSQAQRYLLTKVK